MFKIEIDRRTLTVGDDVGEADMFRVGADAFRRGALLMARALTRMNASKSYRAEGHGSAIDYAVARRIDRRDAAAFLNLGLALEVLPQAADDVLAGRVSVGDAAELGAVTRKQKQVVAAEIERRRQAATGAGAGESASDPETADSAAASAGPDAAPAAGEAGSEPTSDPQKVLEDVMGDLLDRAKEVGSTRFRRDVRELVEAAVQRERVVRLEFAVGESAAKRFRRARLLITRKKRESVTEGEAFTLVVDDFLRRHDDLMKEPRDRRVGPTSERTDDRYIPADVRREVRMRSGDRCEVPGCGNRVFVQFAHRVPDAQGGDREADNMAHLCTDHHVMKDAGYLRILFRDHDGLHVLFTMTGETRSPADDDIGRDIEVCPAPDDDRATDSAAPDDITPTTPDTDSSERGRWTSAAPCPPPAPEVAARPTGGRAPENGGPTNDRTAHLTGPSICPSICPSTGDATGDATDPYATDPYATDPYATDPYATDPARTTGHAPSTRDDDRVAEPPPAEYVRAARCASDTRPPVDDPPRALTRARARGAGDGDTGVGCAADWGAGNWGAADWGAADRRRIASARFRGAPASAPAGRRHFQSRSRWWPARGRRSLSRWRHETEPP